MILTLTRTSSAPDGTLGELAIDGAFHCYTLEPDEDRPQHPAIPCGTYNIFITPSARFHRRLPLIVGVPGRTGIRVHPGNDADDTEGCILLGTGRMGHALVNSRAACDLFQSAIARPLAAGDGVTITINEAFR